MKKLIVTLSLFLCLYFSNLCIEFALSQPESFKQSCSEISQGKAAPFLREVGFLTGYARGNLIQKDNYKFIPLLARFGFDLKPFLQKFNISPKGMVDLVWEPFINAVISPDTNMEAGFTPLLKYAYPLNKRLYPYVEAGSGFIYITQHTREQATQFNFIPQIGAGLNYFFEENTALNITYRFRHLSNSSIKSPNKGINVTMILAGVSYFF